MQDNSRYKRIEAELRNGAVPILSYDDGMFSIFLSEGSEAEGPTLTEALDRMEAALAA